MAIPYPQPMEEWLPSTPPQTPPDFGALVQLLIQAMGPPRSPEDRLFGSDFMGDLMEVGSTVPIGGMNMKPPGGGRPSLPPQPWERADYMRFPEGWSVPQHGRKWGPEGNDSIPSTLPTPLNFKDEPFMGMREFSRQYAAQPEPELWHDVLSFLQHIMGRTPASFPEVTPRNPMHPTMRN